MFDNEKQTGFVRSLRGMFKAVRTFHIHDFALQHPRPYFLLISFLAVLGYGFLLLFPSLAVFGLWQAVEAFRQPLAEPTVLTGVHWIAVCFIGIAISHHIYSIRFSVPKGLALQPEKSPRLNVLLSNTQERAFWPRISQIVITDKYELDIRKIPVCGFPFWSRNVMVIGLPMMQCLSQTYFEILLQRKLIQFARGRNIFTNWLYQISHVWFLYPAAFTERNLLGDQVICWFYKFYAPLFQRCSFYSAQMDELKADSFALAGVNDSDLLKSIEAQRIGQHFVQNYYTPMLMDMLVKKGVAAEQVTPYTRLPQALLKMLTQDRMKQLLKLMCKQKVNRLSTEPPLYVRMENIGHNRVRLPAMPVPPCAAEVILQKNYATLCQIMDKSWAARVRQQLKQQQSKGQSRSVPGRSVADTSVALKYGTASSGVAGGG